MPVTFGSVGDIIATIQIAAQLLKVLSASNGSASEFQDLLIQLRTFHRCLDQLVSFWQTRKQCPELEVLHDLLLPVIKDSQGEISTFLDSIINKYGKSLSHTERSRRNYRNIGKMIQWYLFEGDAIKRLKGKLFASNTTITLVQMNAQGITEEKNKALVNEKLSDLIELENSIEEKLESHFDELMSKIDEQTTILTQISSDVGTVISAVGPVANISREIGELALKLDQHLVLNSTSRGLDVIQHPVFFEDSIGRVLKIPLELIHSWKALGEILCDQFSGRPGHGLVYKGRYIVQDTATGRDLSPRVPFHSAIRPRQNLHMAMLFHSPDEKPIACPRCKRAAISSRGMDFECSNPSCKMIFRHIVDVSELADHATVMEQSLNQHMDRTDAMHIEDDASERLLKWEASEDSPEVFKRVRFLTQWYDAEDSKSNYCIKVGELKLWYPSNSVREYKKQLMERSVPRGRKDICARRQLNNTFWGFFFLGASSQRDSVPVFVIYSKYKERRDFARSITRELPWCRSGCINVVTTSATPLRADIIRDRGFDPDGIK